MRRRFILCATAVAATTTVRVATPDALTAALAAGAARVEVLGAVHLTAPLTLSAPVELVGADAAAALLLDARVGASAVTVRGARGGVALRGLRVGLVGAPAGAAAAALPPALAVLASSGVALDRLVVEGGLRVAGSARVDVGWSDVSNAAGAAGGTCVYVTGCGNSSTLERCDVVVHDNNVHDCRWPGGNASVYGAAAQGILVGAADGDAAGAAVNDGCTVGVVVRNNNVAGVDQMAIRVMNDLNCASVLNQIVFNDVRDWGQLSRANGGDTTDSGCLYVSARAPRYAHPLRPLQRP